MIGFLLFSLVSLLECYCVCVYIYKITLLRYNSLIKFTLFECKIHWMYILHFVYPLVDEYLGFHLSSVVNNAVVNIHIQIFY